MTTEDSRRPVHSSQAASRIYGEDAVIINPGENTVRLLNSTGSRLWQLADGMHTAEEMAVILTEEFDVDLPHARQSVARFLSEMEAKDLITWAED